jgi:hypothetical protein
MNPIWALWHSAQPQAIDEVAGLEEPALAQHVEGLGVPAETGHQDRR